MLKTAIYGILRVTFDLLDTQLWWWGVAGADAGAAHRAVRRAVRRRADRHEAPAGLFLDREYRHHPGRHRPRPSCSTPSSKDALAALALTAALYHALNHAFFKGLLFLGTGSVLHATGERNLGKLGGLIHRMP